MSKLDINIGFALPHHTNILHAFKNLLLGEKPKLSFNLQLLLPRKRLIILEVPGIPFKRIEEYFGRNFFGLLKYSLAET